MSMRAILPVVCLVIAGTLGHSRIVAQQRQLAVSLTDGRKLVGTSESEFELKTGFGRAMIPAKNVASITFAENCVLTAADGTVLTGEMSSQQFSLTTADGDQLIKLKDVAKIAALQRAEMKPETITNGIAENGMTYHLRAPKDFDAKKKYRCIVILHGSNMNSKAYVNTIARTWPDIANRFILIGINGEKHSKSSKAETPRFNYTYVNFAGRSKYKGFPGTDRESPVLVKEVIEEIRGYVDIEKIFIGGHSQGGYLTYVVAMNYPDLIDGAFPISAGMIMQAEPGAFLHERLRAMQRKVPFAIVHAVNDNVVPVKLSEAADGSLRADGFPMLRFFKPRAGAHMFALLPVDDAIEWLEKISSDDPRELLSLARQYVKDEQYRSVPALLSRLQSMKLDAKSKAEVDLMAEEVESVTKFASRKLLKAIMENKNGDWVDNYLLFLDDFPNAETAQPVHAAYRALRAKHEKRGNRLYQSAVKLYRKDEREDAYALFEEIVVKYYACSHYRYAKRILDERKTSEKK